MIAHSRHLTAALVAALAVLLSSGAVAAYAVGHGAIAGTGVVDVASGGSTTGAATTATEATSATGAPTDATTAPDGGPVEVTLSPSAENSRYATAVTDLISRYFTAINRGDYDAWLATVSTGQAKRDRDSWTVDYSTTQDSEIYISDITPGDPLTVRMQFVSHQALEFAPAALPATCVRWDVTYKILDEGVGLRVDTSAKQPALASC